MKKILSMVFAALFCASIAFGAVGIKVNNVHQGTASDINFPTGTTVTTSDGSTFSVSPVVGAVAAVTSGTISGVTINSSTIGATTPSTAVFTTASATTLSATNLSATNMNSTAIGATTPSTAVFTTLRATSMDSTAIGSTTPSTAVFTTASATNFSATNINSTAIGATTPSTAVFTTCTTTGRFVKDVAALTPGASVTVDCSLADVFTLTPAEAESIVASNVTPGQNVTLVITTSGTTDYTLTFATGFTTTGTLATGTSDAKVFVMDFISTGTTLKEKSRTTAM